jgi:pyruvate formate lyase activating enzyme
MVNAVVLDFQRLSTEDGPGLRTTVFFKGCSLACTWCHNPESIPFRRQVQWVDTRCIGCRTCLATCVNSAVSLSEAGLQLDRVRCLSCATCVEACPGGALEVKGSEWTLPDLVHEVLKDRAYFGQDGGVTVSGGEALMQIAFVEKFLAELKAGGVHTTVDTAGYLAQSTLERALPYTDLIMLDLKIFDPTRHLQFTGADNDKILRNAEFLAALPANHRSELWIRTPIIPGITDAAENIAAIGRFIGETLRNVPTKWELCSFNNLCADKYQRLDLDWDFAGTPLVSRAEMENLYQVALASGVNPQIVSWSGAVRE